MNLKQSLASLWNYAFRFLAWLLTACLIGCLCGVAGGLFAMAVEWATHFRGENGWLLYLLPVGGLLIAGMYRLMKLPLNIGTDKIIETVRSQATLNVPPLTTT